MDAEAYIARALEGRFFRIDGTDANEPKQVEREPEQLEAPAIVEEPKPEPVSLLPIRKRATFQAILAAVAEVHGKSISDILGLNRSAKTVRARQHVMALTRELTTFSLISVGQRMNRDHATVKHGVSTWEARKAQCPVLAQRDERVRAMLFGKSES